MSLVVKKLSAKAVLPSKATPQAAGYDLSSSQTITLLPQSATLVDIDLVIAVPNGTYGRIAPRSGLASKHFIDVGAGVVDADYRGPVKVLLFNHALKPYIVKEGDRIAQLILEKIVTDAQVVECDALDKPTEMTKRGANGFGSTGN